MIEKPVINPPNPSRKVYQGTIGTFVKRAIIVPNMPLLGSQRTQRAHRKVDINQTNTTLKEIY